MKKGNIPNVISVLVCRQNISIGDKFNPRIFQSMQLKIYWFLPASCCPISLDIYYYCKGIVPHPALALECLGTGAFIIFFGST